MNGRYVAWIAIPCICGIGGPVPVPGDGAATDQPYNTGDEQWVFNDNWRNRNSRSGSGKSSGRKERMPVVTTSGVA